MRLAVLDKGHGFGTRVLFGIIQMASRQPVFDVIKLVKYRPDFYGAPMQKVTHEAMRGTSAWSVGDRELMAAVVAQANDCEWCTKVTGPWPGAHIGTRRRSRPRSVTSKRRRLASLYGRPYSCYASWRASRR